MTLTLNLIYAGAVLVLGFITAGLLGRFVRGAAERSDWRPAISEFLSRLARYALILLAVGIALGFLGVSASPIAAVVASLGFAAALALRGLLASLVAGIQILAFAPFKIGDRVTLVREVGVVVDIGLFFTTLRSPTLRTVTLSNSKILSAAVVNHSDEIGETTVAMTFGMVVPTLARHKQIYEKTIQALRKAAPPEADDAVFRVVSFSKSEVLVGMKFKVAPGKANTVRDFLNYEALEIFQRQNLAIHDPPTVVVQ